MAEPYSDDWTSLLNYTVPEWYADAKFGTWPTWGVYSVPARCDNHAAEWYGRWMYTTEENTDPRGYGTVRNHHYAKYGNPRDFGYKDFVPMFKAEHWNPDEWVAMAVDVGAKFFCMMGTHHDGFALYRSRYTRWNAVEMGPKRDLVGEMARAVRRRGLKFGISNHLAWNAEFFRFNHENGFDAADPATHDLYSEGVFDEKYLEQWWNRTVEMVDLFEPDLYYFDWGWNTDAFAKLRPEFAAYFYNKAVEGGKGVPGDPGVVLNYKNECLRDGCGVLDLEREALSEIRPMVWQTDTSISKRTWGYGEDDDSYRTGEELVHTLVDVVSKNGVLMLNFGPKADGTVPREYKTPLEDMGAWLKKCGEAIYDTRPYRTYGEGEGTQKGGENHRDERRYDARVVRFTRSKDHSTLYAVLLGWPGTTATINTLKRGRFDAGAVTSIRLLGTTETLKWYQDDRGLHVSMPRQKPYECAYPLQIRLR